MPVSEENKQVRIYYGSGTVDKNNRRVKCRIMCIYSSIRPLSWPPSWKYDVIKKIGLRHSMLISTWRTILPNFVPTGFEMTENKKVEMMTIGLQCLPSARERNI